MVVSFDGRIEMADTLDEALAEVFGISDIDPGDRDGGDGDPPPGDETLDEQVRRLLAEADAAFRAADEALLEGDLVRWAEEIERAQEAVEEANRLLRESATGT